MYIPYGFFGEQEVTNCLTASQVGEETGLFQSGSDVWQYHIWSSSGDYILEVTGSNTGSRVVLIGGGGFGGSTVQCNRDPSGFNAGRIAGGGGAGGVFDAPYTLVTRQFQIHVGSGSQHTASFGEDSWVKPLWNPNHPYPYPVYNSPSGGNQNISAEGGGFGAAVAWDYGYFGPNNPATQDGGAGGSGGGGAAGLMSNGPLPGIVGWFPADPGSGRTGQGFDGGEVDTEVCGNTSEYVATGGGGAGEPSPDTNCFSQAGYLTPGGNGIELNIDGVPRYFAAGGGAVRNGVWENATLGLGSPGSGGSGSTDYYTGGAGNFDDPGFLDGFNLKWGRDGLAAILIPLCEDQLSDCVQYELEGGASGGNFTFIACGSGSLTTYTLQPNETTTVCGFAGEVRFFPSASGDVTYNKTTSSCEVYIEPCPPDSGSCVTSSCETIVPQNHKIYDIQITGSKSFAPTLAPAVELTYTDCDNSTLVTEILNSGSIDMFDNIREWNICADSNHGISASVLDGDVTSSVNVIDSGFICGEYCVGIPLTDTPITASGGETGSFISGSYIYKYHIFESSGSSNEATNRSFQELDIVDGYSDEINILLIGGGGPGAEATGFNDGTLKHYYGGGGGAGQVKTTTIHGGICNGFTLNVAPGFGYPFTVTPTPDNWQESFGKTIISASDGSLYNIAGSGGRATSYKRFANYSSTTDWNNRSGSGGGGTAVDEYEYVSGAVSYESFNGGDGYLGTGSAGGGGGAGENGYDGTSGSTAIGGKGGDGILLNFTGTSTYYAGGGSGYGPGGGTTGGLGGGGNSVDGLSTGSFYGAGGGAWLEPQQNYTTPWGATYPLNGRGADGVVIITYKWKEDRTPPTDNIIERGLSQYYDMYSKDSYDGTGSLVYNLWNNNTTASLENIGGFRFDTDNLGSGSLLIETASLRPYVESDIEQPSYQISAMCVWEVNNQTYDINGLLPILTDEQFGTSSLGIYAGNNTLYGEAVVVKVGDTLVATKSGSAGSFIPRGGFHISQFSYNQGTNELLWYVDGNSGSATVNETIEDKTFLLNFNSSSLSANLGNNSVYNITAIYTSSLDYEEMRHNDNFLYPRY